jgi:hypothetical protein
MNPPAPKDSHHNPETVFVGELQRFTDPPGGAPLDDPAVQERERQRRAGRGDGPPPTSDSSPPGRTEPPPG